MENTPIPMSADAVLDREFLEIRAKVLEIAASLDRLDRGEGSTQSDPRMDLILEGIKLLSESQPARAERVQMLFSREYSDQWRQEFGI